jgi:thiol-disulfide isomerase/thioredoxin
MLARFKDYDFYRRIPRDLTEASTHGSILSVCASLFMMVLFVAELWAYITQSAETHVIIDPQTSSLLRINFNISIMDLPCEYAVIDVIDVLGSRKDNITKNINKWKIDAQGVKRNYEGRNLDQKDILHDLHHDLQKLNDNGIHAVPVDENSWDDWVSGHHYTFANFYAPWCVHCQRLEPVWEAFAEKIEELDLPVSIVKIDCVANEKLCSGQQIHAFPSLRMFRESELQPPDYQSDRTVEAMLAFVKSTLKNEQMLDNMHPTEKAEVKERQLAERDDHPGCLLTGFLLVNRVPGNFHIEARSKHHNLNPAMANTSHVVNHLSFGPVLPKRTIKKIDSMSKELFDIKSTHMMDGDVYLNNKKHQAFHHYIKVISTSLQPSLAYTGRDAILAYQMVQSSQVMQVGLELRLGLGLE